MKQCKGCKKTLSNSSFHKSRCREDGLHIYCRACKKLQSHKYYKVNRERLRKKSKKRDVKYRQRAKQFLVDLKLKCANCGEGDFRCLDFYMDNMKRFDMCSICAISSLKKAVSQYKLLCLNCHTKLSGKTDD